MEIRDHGDPSEFLHCLVFWH